MRKKAGGGPSLETRTGGACFWLLSVIEISVLALGAVSMAANAYTSVHMMSS